MDPEARDELVDALRAENEELRARIAEWEAAALEYRRLMNGIVTSFSWRVTSPLRMSAGRMRLLIAWFKSWPRRWRRLAGPGKARAGLFTPAEPPARSRATADSPLLKRPHLVLPARLGQPEPHRANRIVVVAHVFYPEVWRDIEERLERLSEPYDLLVSLVRDEADGLEPQIKERFPDAQIRCRGNSGRDLGALMEFASLGLLDGYDAILKVHTKRSPHRFDGDGWRQKLLDGVLPSAEGVRRIIELLRTDRDVGLVVPPGSISGEETWGSNRELVEALALRFPIGFDPAALAYPAGSMYWARPWVIRRLADLAIGPEHFEPEAGHLDGSTAHALERFAGILTTASGLDIVESNRVAARLKQKPDEGSRRPRTFAFYLPQYHRIPENDGWWGEGFTDWVNVERAEPLFEGHLQPEVPGELGCYDLSDPEVMRSQGQLAAEYGLDGFIMYRYWFDGRELLETPLRNLLADPTIEFPFALCWANEKWTRRWDGLESDVLVEQHYADGWVDSFYDDLVPVLRDRRYIHVAGKPLLVIYRMGEIPDAAKAFDRWRARAQQDGFGGLHILAVIPSREFHSASASDASAVDGWIRFPPGSGIALRSLVGMAPQLVDDYSGEVFSYDAAVDGADLATTDSHGQPIHPGVMPGWDNTPRRAHAAHVFHRGNPVSFRRWLARARHAAAAADRMVFINAWNEWAEGAHLEPDARFGRANLEAVRDVLGTP